MLYFSRYDTLNWKLEMVTYSQTTLWLLFSWSVFAEFLYDIQVTAASFFENFEDCWRWIFMPSPAINC